MDMLQLGLREGHLQVLMEAGLSICVSVKESCTAKAYCDASGREFSYLDFCNSFRRRASDAGLHCSFPRFPHGRCLCLTPAPLNQCLELLLLSKHVLLALGYSLQTLCPQAALPAWISCNVGVVGVVHLQHQESGSGLRRV